MNIKVATKYQINEYAKAIKTYYLIVILVMAFFGAVSMLNKTGSSGFSGIEGSSMIFLFILGLNSFKDTFLMMLQNGITRKSMFIGRIITIFATGFKMAVIDRFIVNLGGLLNDMSDRITFKGMFESFFAERAESLNIVLFNLEVILITASVYIAAMVAGCFITTAYYRMSKMLKIAVSIGVPTSILIVLPMLDSAVFKGKIAVTMGKFFGFIFGGRTGNPYNLLLSCVVFAVIGLGLTWLLIRKAVEKN